MGDDNSTFKPLELQSNNNETIKTLIVPKELETEFILQCDEEEVLDPTKVIEMYLAQRKYEMMELMFARKKSRLESEYSPSYSDLKALKKKKKGHNTTKMRAKYIMNNTVKVKSVFCHSTPDEDAFGKIIRYRTNI